MGISCTIVTGPISSTSHTSVTGPVSSSHTIDTGTTRSSHTCVVCHVIHISSAFYLIFLNFSSLINLELY